MSDLEYIVTVIVIGNYLLTSSEYSEKKVLNYLTNKLQKQVCLVTRMHFCSAGISQGFQLRWRQVQVSWIVVFVPRVCSGSVFLKRPYTVFCNFSSCSNISQFVFYVYKECHIVPNRISTNNRIKETWNLLPFALNLVSTIIC